MYNLFLILIISYIIGVNIAGLTMLLIQKKEFRKLKLKFVCDNNIVDESLKVNFANSTESSDDENNSENKQICDCGSATEGDISQKRELDEKEKLKISDKIRLTNEQHKELKKFQKKKCLPDFLLLGVAAFGGATTMYASMFFAKFKLNNLLFMLTMPLLCGLNIFLLVQLFTVWIVP